MILNPEELAEIRIGRWLQKNGLKVFINRDKGIVKEILDCGVFKVEGSRNRPDMLIYQNSEKEYYKSVIEIKSGVSGKNIRDSVKIIDYYNEYLDGVSYFVNNKVFDPRYFLVASYFSPEGHLFSEDVLKPEMLDPQTARMHGTPQKEYIRTGDFIRQLWNDWGKHPDYRIGALLSSVLNNNGTIPFVFFMGLHKRQSGNFTYGHKFYPINNGGF